MKKTEEEIHSKVLPNKDVAIQNGQFGEIRYDHEKGKGVFEPKGKALYLCKIIEEWEKEEFYWELKFEVNGQERMLCVPRAEINRSGLLKLAAKGVDVYEHNVSILIKSMQNQQMELSRKEGSQELIHLGVGWYDITYADGEKQRIYRAHEICGNFESAYRGELAIKPAGSMDGWRDFIAKEVLGHPQLETMVILGLSAVLNSYMQNKTKLENFIFHIMGESSTGKTTAAYLAVSTTGQPAFGKSTLLRSWGATANALKDCVLNNHGMVVVFDEISKFLGKDLTDMVYYFAEGTEKARSNKDGNVRESRTFQTTIISTGEGSLINKCMKNNSGLKVRVCEFETKWTENAEHSRRIKEGCSLHYGHAALALAKWLQTKDMNDLLERKSYWQKQYLTQREKQASELEARSGERYGILMLTAELSMEALHMEFDLNGILQFFIENDKRVGSIQNIGLEAYERLITFVQSRYYHFQVRGLSTLLAEEPTLDEEEYEFPSANVPQWGIIEDIRKNGIISRRYIILCDECERILQKELQYEDAKLVLREIKKQGFLDCEKDRLYRKRKLYPHGKDNSSKVYVLLGESHDKISSR